MMAHGGHCSSELRPSMGKLRVVRRRQRKADAVPGAWRTVRMTPTSMRLSSRGRWEHVSGGTHDLGNRASARCCMLRQALFFSHFLSLPARILLTCLGYNQSDMVLLYLLSVWGCMCVGLVCMGWEFVTGGGPHMHALLS
jgi:hypothetical protein